MTVPLRLLRDQHHVWKVHPWFLAGSITRLNRWKRGIAAALDHCVVWTRRVDDFPCWKTTLDRGILRPLRSIGNAIQQLVSAPVRRFRYSPEQVRDLVDRTETCFVALQLDQMGFHHDAAIILAEKRIDEKAWEGVVDCLTSNSSDDALVTLLRNYDLKGLLRTSQTALRDIGEIMNGYS